MEAIVHGPELATSSVCEPILRSLPEWFGIEEATRQYIQEIEAHPTFLATLGGEVAGFLTLKHHGDHSAEVIVMGVRPEWHRRGIGRTLQAAAEEFLLQQGVEYLQVKTLSESHPDPNYARTRAFYSAMGFRPLQELPGLWGPANPCLQMIKRL